MNARMLCKIAAWAPCWLPPSLIALWSWIHILSTHTHTYGDRGIHFLAMIIFICSVVALVIGAVYACVNLSEYLNKLCDEAHGTVPTQLEMEV